MYTTPLSVWLGLAASCGPFDLLPQAPLMPSFNMAAVNATGELQDLTVFSHPVRLLVAHKTQFKTSILIYLRLKGHLQTKSWISSRLIYFDCSTCYEKPVFRRLVLLQ